MTLSKMIPAQTLTMTARWCMRDFTRMNESYRANFPFGSWLDCCFWCGDKFANGDTIALANFEEVSGNKVLCKTCADKLVASAPPQ